MDREQILQEIYSRMIKMLNKAYQPNPYEIWKTTYASKTDDELRRILSKLRQLTEI